MSKSFDIIFSKYLMMVMVLVPAPWGGEGSGGGE